MEKSIEEYISVNSNNLITSFVWSGLLDKAKCGELLEIIKQCSVEAEHIEELQEIRQEINQKGRDKFSLNDEYEHYLKGLTDCLDIIDSHISALSRKEQE